MPAIIGSSEGAREIACLVPEYIDMLYTRTITHNTIAQEDPMAGTFTSLQYHCVFSTKNRAPLIHEELRGRLYEFIGGVVRSECPVLKSGKRNGGLIAIGGMPDHVHLLVRWPANRTVSDLMRIVKSKSSGWVSETFPARRSFRWQEGYGAFSASKSGISAIETYIANQAEHHRTQSFQEEFIAFLRLHEIDFDPETIWL